MKAAPSLLLLLGACAPALVEPLPPAAPVGQTVAWAGGRAWTVNPEEGALVGWRPGEAPVRWPIGRGPTALVANGDRAFLSLRGERALAELDLSAATPRVVARVPVGPEPIGVALSPDGRRVYVAVSLSDEVVAVDVAARTVVARYPVPGQPRGVAVHPSGARLFATALRTGAWVVHLGSGAVAPVQLPRWVDGAAAPRASGDPAVSPDGRVLVVPTVAGDRFEPPGPFALAWISGALTEVPLDPADGALLADGLSVWSVGVGVVRKVAFSPAGELMFVAGASNGPIIVAPSPSARRELDPAFIRWHRLALAGAHGVTGVAFDGDGGALLATDGERGLVGVELTDLDVASTEEVVPTPRSARLVSWPTGLSDLRERGRRLFDDLDDRRVTAGVAACATCHVDGRTDGQSWRVDGVALQTPTLAEGLRAHVPLGWSADQPAVADSARAMVVRLGGRGLEPPELRALQAYLDALEPPDVPSRGARTPEADRGRALFESLGCARCHAGEAYTDRALHALADRPAVATPSLRGVSATAPYLVDGSAPSLEAVVQAAPRLGMGATDALSPDDAAALVAFLRSL